MSGTVGAATTNAEFGQGSGPIHYARLSCSGSEISLSRCGSIASTAADCSHNSDVGVRCAEIQNSGEGPIMFMEYSSIKYTWNHESIPLAKLYVIDCPLSSRMSLTYREVPFKQVPFVNLECMYQSTFPAGILLMSLYVYSV